MDTVWAKWCLWVWGKGSEGKGGCVRGNILEHIIMEKYRGRSVEVCFVLCQGVEIRGV